MSTPIQPETVQPGQMWKDNDQRTKGSGEFVIEEATYTHAQVRRLESGRRSTIAVDRLLGTSHLQRGYTYIGMKR